MAADDNLARAATHAQPAHAAAVAIARKNTTDQVPTLRALGHHFAVTELCLKFEECVAYTAEYDVVLDIEYTDGLGGDGFVDVCGDPARLAVKIFRNSSLTAPGDAE